MTLWLAFAMIDYQNILFRSTKISYEEIDLINYDLKRLQQEILVVLKM
jgi:hypothetical protein